MTAFTEPIVAFRRWNVVVGGRLSGLGYGHIWETTRLTAECKGTMSVVVRTQPDGRRSIVDYPLDIDGFFTSNVVVTPTATIHQIVTCSTKVTVDEIGHTVPLKNSFCGIWAHKLPIPLCQCYRPLDRWHGAIGAVRLWGKVIEHEHGWRAEHAEIAGIWDSTGRLNDSYNVRRFNSPDELYAEWAPDWDKNKVYTGTHDRFYCDQQGVNRARRRNVQRVELPPHGSVIQRDFDNRASGCVVREWIDNDGRVIEEKPLKILPEYENLGYSRLRYLID